MSPRISRLGGALGAEVTGIDLASPLGNRDFDRIHQAFLDHLVLFFRDQDLTEDEHKAFGRRFGDLNIHPRYVPLEGHPEIFPIRKDPADKRIVGERWHQWPQRPVQRVLARCGMQRVEAAGAHGFRSDGVGPALAQLLPADTVANA